MTLRLAKLFQMDKVKENSLLQTFHIDNPRPKRGLKKPQDITISSLPKINRSQSLPLISLISRRKEYCKIQIKFLQIPENTRKTTIIGNRPIDFLKPNKAEFKPFKRISLFERLKQMKGFGESAKQFYILNKT